MYKRQGGLPAREITFGALRRSVASSAPLRNAWCAQFSRAPVNQRVCGIGSAVRTCVHGVVKSTL